MRTETSWAVVLHAIASRTLHPRRTTTPHAHPGWDAWVTCEGWRRPDSTTVRQQPRLHKRLATMATLSVRCARRGWRHWTP
jgi:hypothetical protein